MRTYILGNALGVLNFQMIQIKDQATSLEALALKTKYAKKQNADNYSSKTPEAKTRTGRKLYS